VESICGKKLGSQMIKSQLLGSGRQAGPLKSTLEEPAPCLPLNSSTLVDPDCACQVVDHYVDTNHVHIHYVDVTDGLEVDKNLPPVIILHGMFGSSRNLVRWAKNLASELSVPRKIIVMDLRNHGQSEWLDSMTYFELASDILQIYKKEGFESAILVGHSLGGKIACQLALRCSRRVSGLVALDVAPVAYSPDKDQGWFAITNSLERLANLPLGMVTTKAEADRLLQAHIPDDAKRAFCLTQLQPDPHTKRLRWTLNIRALQSNIDELASFDTSDLDFQSAYHADTLFIAAEQSAFLRPGDLAAMNALFPGHDLKTVKGAGHWVHIDAPERTLELVSKYIDHMADTQHHETEELPSRQQSLPASESYYSISSHG